MNFSANFGLMGSGFECEIVTSAGGSVIWGSGIVATNGGTGLAGSSYAKLVGFTSSVGNTVLACAGSASPGGSVSAPGTISNLAAAAITASSITYTWNAPSRVILNMVA